MSRCRLGRWCQAATLVMAAMLAGLVPQVAVPSTRPAHGQPTPTRPGWVALGPSGPWRASEVVASTGWPTDPFLFARLAAASPILVGGVLRPAGPPPPHRAARSSDGGRLALTTGFRLDRQDAGPQGIGVTWILLRREKLMSCQPRQVAEVHGSRTHPRPL
jgi:hypothetical protein